jgi:tetratricopeptide (TPR) repeat protein
MGNADADRFDGLCRLADTALQAEAWHEAVSLLRRALAIRADAALLHAALGQALQRLGLGSEAIASFRLAAQVDPECADAYAGLAAEMGRGGNLEERDDFLRRWLAIRIRRDERTPAAPALAMQIPDTTLVCVDCRYHDLAAHALSRVLARCRFERVVLFTDADLQLPGVEVVRIAPLCSIQAYSHFILKELDRHIETGFALVMQYDGYVLNGACWSDEFQDYDYVGAPWKHTDGMAVGNGGFSLRSKRLLRALQDPEILSLPIEDIAVCRTYRPLLEERHGIRFAPPAIAARFSFESLPPPGPTFGFHGIDHLYYLLDMSEAEIAAYRPPR